MKNKKRHKWFYEMEDIFEHARLFEHGELCEFPYDFKEKDLRTLYCMFQQVWADMRGYVDELERGKVMHTKLGYGIEK